MSRTRVQSQGDLGPVRFSAIAGLRARLTHLDLMDWVVLLLLALGIWVAFYTTSLRHP